MLFWKIASFFFRKFRNMLGNLGFFGGARSPVQPPRPKYDRGTDVGLSTCGGKNQQQWRTTQKTRNKNQTIKCKCSKKEKTHTNKNWKQIKTQHKQNHEYICARARTHSNKQNKREGRAESKCIKKIKPKMQMYLRTYTNARSQKIQI